MQLVPFANDHTINSNFYFGLECNLWILVKLALLFTFGNVKNWILRFFFLGVILEHSKVSFILKKGKEEK